MLTTRDGKNKVIPVVSMLCLCLGDLLVLNDSVMLSLVCVDLLRLCSSLVVVKVLVDKKKADFSWSLLSR